MAVFFGRRVVWKVGLFLRDREDAMARREESISAMMIFWKCSVVARAEASRRPIAPAPKTRAEVSSPAEEAASTS